MHSNEVGAKMRKNVLSIIMAAAMLLSLLVALAPPVVNAAAQGDASDYSFPQHNLTSAQIAAVTEALEGLLEGEVERVYRLAGDLYYAVVSQNGRETGGAVVREGRQGGQIMFHVLHSDALLLSEDALVFYIAQAAGTPNVTIDFNAAALLPTLSECAEYLTSAIRDTDGTTPNNAALSEIATYIQFVIGNQGTATLIASENRFVVSDGDVLYAAEAAVEAYDELTGVLTRSNIDLGRPISAVIRIEGQNIDPDEAAQITFAATLADIIGENSIMLLLGDNRYAVTIAGADLRTLTEEYGALTVQIERNSDGLYIIVFIDGSGEIIDRLSAPVTITLPATGMFDTVFASFGGVVDNWGGQFDELAGTILFSTPFSGSYEVMENLLEITDIHEFSDEMQSIVRFMVSKGFFSLTEGRFEPDDALTRYDFSATLVRMFFALDRSLSTSFIDVPPESDNYSYIASGEHEGLIAGIGENLFAGERIMTRQEAVTLAARTLTGRRDYTYPANIDEYIAQFSDGDEIADWARSAVALAVREGIVDRSSSFAPLSDITRAETAMIMYQLFLLLYEAPPVEIRMSLPDQASGGGGNRPAIDQAGNATSPFTMILFMIIGFVIFCLVIIACAFYAIFVRRKRKVRHAIEEYEDVYDDVFEEQEQTQAHAMPGTFAMEFPDTNFCNEVLRILNNQDGGGRADSSHVTEYDLEILAEVPVLNLRKKDIKSLKGVEYFSSLTRLDCANNKLKELNLSFNTKLKQILCFGNQLTELDVSKNVELVNLYCYSNRLREMDLSKNAAMETLNCANNLLKELDISANAALTGFHCFSNYMDPDPNVSVPDWQSRWSDPGTSWDGSPFQFFPQNTV